MKIEIGLPFDIENPDSGGFIHSFNTIKQALSKNDLTIYSPFGGDIKLINSKKNISSGGRVNNTLQLAKDFANKINSKKTEKILCFTDMGLFLNKKFVSFTSNVPSKKAIKFLENEYPSEEKYKKIIREFKEISTNEEENYSKAEKIIVFSDKIKEDLIEQYSISEKKIHYIPRPIPNYSNEIIKKTKSEKEMRIILMPSELRVRKGIKYAIETMKIIKSKVPNAVLLICGKINPYEKEYIQKLLTESKGKANIIVAGYLPKKKLYEYMKNADCAFMPFIFDECPISLSECLGHDLPIITNYYCGYNKKIIEKFGYYANHNDIDDYAKGIEALLKNKKLNDSKRREIEELKKELTFEKFEEKINNVFEKI